MEIPALISPSPGRQGMQSSGWRCARWMPCTPWCLALAAVADLWCCTSLMLKKEHLTKLSCKQFTPKLQTSSFFFFFLVKYCNAVKDKVQQFLVQDPARRRESCCTQGTVNALYKSTFVNTVYWHTYWQSIHKIQLYYITHWLTVSLHDEFEHINM